MQAINNDLVVFAGKDSLNVCNNQLWTYNLINNSWLSVSTLTATLRKGGMGFTNAGTYYYTCGISQADVRLKETWKTAVSVGIKEFEKKEEIHIYPNPASDFINVISSNSILNREVYKIIGMKGEIALEGIMNENNQIDIGTLNKGVYQLLIANSSVRLIIQ